MRGRISVTREIVRRHPECPQTLQEKRADPIGSTDCEGEPPLVELQLESAGQLSGGLEMRPPVVSDATPGPDDADRSIVREGGKNSGGGVRVGYFAQRVRIRRRHLEHRVVSIEQAGVDHLQHRPDVVTPAVDVEYHCITKTFDAGAVDLHGQPGGVGHDQIERDRYRLDAVQHRLHRVCGCQMDEDAQADGLGVRQPRSCAPGSREVCRRTSRPTGHPVVEGCP
nr:hypothetical protein [Skermania piniformis]